MKGTLGAVTVMLLALLTAHVAAGAPRQWARSGGWGCSRGEALESAEGVSPSARQLRELRVCGGSDVTSEVALVGRQCPERLPDLAAELTAGTCRWTSSWRTDNPAITAAPAGRPAPSQLSWCSPWIPSGRGS